MCKAMGKLDGLPDFPIDSSYMPGVRKRMKLCVKADDLSRTQVLSPALSPHPKPGTRLRVKPKGFGEPPARKQTQGVGKIGF
jgi:hypothetical protein